MHLQKPTEEISSRAALGGPPTLTEAEERKILVEFNRTQADYRRDLCVHQLFEAQVERTPDATAVVCEEQRLTYRELNSRANRLAHYLCNRDAGPDVLVGICVERSPEMLVGVLGILKAGAAYVPVDPSYPKDRLAVILEDAKAPLVLTQRSLLDSLPRCAGQAICLDTDWPAIVLESAENPVSQVKPENLVYVIYTSGSTGKPKGVCLPHRALTNLLFWQLENSHLPAGSRTLQFTSLSFDVSFQEIFSTLCGGGCLALVSDPLRRDARRLLRFLREDDVARLFLPFVALQHLAEAACEEKNLPLGLREVVTAGEQLKITRQLVSFFGRMPQCSLHNHYGPSETHVVTAFQMLGPPDSWPAVPPIGKPIANVQTYILDANLRPVPVGVSGELHVGGVALAQGYLNRPELTAERFIPHPLAAESKEKLYKTGDMARYLADGQIEFQGRADNQVKIRGYRVELGEVECALGKHPAVKDCVVTAREDMPSDRRLVGYIVLRATERPGSTELRVFLKHSLPEYMVPSLFVMLDAFPLTPSGKVDRRALPAPDWSKTASTVSVPARDQLELTLLEIWRRALGNPNMGITDNFFDLGGHSLTAAHLLAEVERIVRREIPLDSFLRGATVESMAQLLRERSESIPDPVLMTIHAGDSSAPFFAIVPPGEDSLGYAILARHMGADQRVYKLQGTEPVIAGRASGSFTQEELRALSSEYIAAIRTAQPEGPYCLGAYCEGVQIAERMVLDLEAQGHEVALFAIFDTWVLQNVQRPLLWRLTYYVERLKALRKMSIGEQVHAYKQAVQSNLRRVVRPGQPTVNREIQQAYWPEGFVARRFRAPVALFKKPKQPFFYINDPYMGWRARSEGGVEIHEVNFDHDEIFREPYVRTMGELLAAGLRRVSEHVQTKRQPSEIQLSHALSENV